MFSPLANVTGHEVPILIPYTNRHCSKMAVSAATFNSFIKYQSRVENEVWAEILRQNAEPICTRQNGYIYGECSVYCISTKNSQTLFPTRNCMCKKNDIDY